jgi:hypothetical protein
MPLPRVFLAVVIVLRAGVNYVALNCSNVPAVCLGGFFVPYKVVQLVNLIGGTYNRYSPLSRV